MTVWGANNELYHHGILGQKWGVRRYQNKDGTLTDAGRKRYQKGLDKLVSRPEAGLDNTLWDIDGAIKDAKDRNNQTMLKLYNDIKNIYKTGIIPKDFEMYRSTTNENESLGSSRKYVSLNPEAAYDYLNPDFLVGFDSKTGEPPSLKVYKSKRPLKIAPAKEVGEYLAKNNLNDKQLAVYKNVGKETNKLLSKYSNISMERLKGPKNITKREQQALDYVAKYENMNKTLAREFLYRNNNSDTFNRYQIKNNAIEYFKGKGYDAIPDLEDDPSSNRTFAPIILLNPQNSVYEKSIPKNMTEYEYLKTKWQ